MVDDRRRDCHESWLQLIDGHRESLVPHSGQLAIQLGA